MVDTNISDSDSSKTPTNTAMKRSLSPEPPLPPEKSGHRVASREAERSAPGTTQRRRVHDGPIRVLVLGRSGSGKTHIIQTLCDGAEQTRVRRTFEPTKEPHSIHVQIGESTFDLVDTPGFDNVNMSDVEVFVKVANYLLDPRRVKAGTTGIIYVHRAGDVIQSRSILRNIQVLIDVFLQKVGTSRLTILEAQVGVQRVAHFSLLSEIQSQPSALGRARELGANVSGVSGRSGFIDLLVDYISRDPIMLPIQVERPGPDLVTRIESILGSYEQESVQTFLRNQEHSLRETYEAKLAHQLEAQSHLRQQLKESEMGYSSLRSQLQLQENVEQSEVVQALNDLNRMIDDIGRSISAYLIDTYIADTPGRDPSKVTARDAVDLPSLKTLLGHVDGKPSIIMTSSGRGMQIESFFDFAIRHLICRHLTKEIFRPFHPGIQPRLSQILIMTQENIQKQSPQVIAGKWRSETFRNIHRGDPETRENDINAQIDKLMNDKLKPLTRYFFGRDIFFSEDYQTRLYRLMEVAWDWNSKLKGEVIVLGDFVQTSFAPHSRFKPEYMEEFEPNPRNPRPLGILGTLALGLLTQRAVGGGNPVEETVVVKAIVLTRNAFA